MDVEELAAFVKAVAAAAAELPGGKTADADGSLLRSMVLNPLMLGTARWAEFPVIRSSFKRFEPTDAWHCQICFFL